MEGFPANPVKTADHSISVAKKCAFARMAQDKFYHFFVMVKFHLADLGREDYSW